jgi:hypothetical protein
MKHTLALVLMVFGIVGCASTSTYDANLQKNLNNYANQVRANKRLSASEVDSKYEELLPFKALARPINFGKGVSYGFGMAGNTSETNKFLSQDDANAKALQQCEGYFGTCLIFKEGDIKVWEDKQAELRIANIKDADERKATLEKLAIAKKQRTKNQQIRLAKLEMEKKEKLRKQKEKILADLKQRCEEYGFTGESNISACIQREAQHDKELAMQKYELQKTRVALQQAQSQAQSRAYAQSLPPVVEEEEEVPWLIKFLGDVAIGVAEGYEHQAMHPTPPAPKQDIYRNCRPNC